MKNRSFSFYLNTFFVLLIAGLLICVGAITITQLQSILTDNMLSRLDVSLEEALLIVEKHRDMAAAKIEQTVRVADLDEMIQQNDTSGLERIVNLTESEGDYSYCLIVDEEGIVLASNQELVGSTWSLSYLLDDAKTSNGVILTTEILSKESVASCSQTFRDHVLVEGDEDQDTVEDAYLELAVMPIRDESGYFCGAIVSGYLLNNNHDLAVEYTDSVPGTYLSAGTKDGTRILSNIDVLDFSFPEGSTQTEEYSGTIARGETWRGVVSMVNTSDKGIVVGKPLTNHAGEVIGNIGVGAPIKTVPELTGQTVRMFLLVFVIFFLISAAVVRYLTKLITRPLENLKNLSHSVSTNKCLPETKELEGRVVPSEIREVSEDIYSMAEQLTTENVRLEQMVAARTLELDNTIDELRAANRHKSQFLANISHELRTPLNSIIGFTSLIKDQVPGPTNETQDRYLDIVLKSSSHLLDLINDILNLVKLDSGIYELKPCEISIPEFIEEASVTILPSITERSQTLDVDIPDRENFPKAYWDERRMRQVLLNLLANATKFTDEGGTIIVSASIQANDMVSIVVADTGIGVPDDMKEKVFLAFEQADNSYTRKFKGVGLGLSITKNIVEQHQGQVWLEDNPGGGTRACVLVPLRPDFKKGVTKDPFARDEWGKSQ